MAENMPKYPYANLPDILEAILKRFDGRADGDISLDEVAHACRDYHRLADEWQSAYNGNVTSMPPKDWEEH